MRRNLLTSLLLSLALTAGLGACAEDSSSHGGPADGPLRLGAFQNLTHAPAILGLEEGTFEAALGATPEIQWFNAGGSAIEALFAGQIDATFIGPGPAISGFDKSNGDAIRVVSGVTLGGAGLVVSDEIETVDDLPGTTIATPQLGNTQDIALRSWLGDQGIPISESESADGVFVFPQENGAALEAFRQGQIDGAWVPEPWLSRMLLEGDGRLLLDESDLWPNGRFATTVLAVRPELLENEPETVRALIEATVDQIEAMNADPAAAQRSITDALSELTGSPVALETIEAAWKRIRFDPDPVAASLETNAEHAAALDFVERADVAGLVDLTILDEILEARGREAIGE